VAEAWNNSQFKNYIKANVTTRLVQDGHQGLILINNQLDAQFFSVYVYFDTLRVLRTL